MDTANYLEFKNKGEVPINAFKLLGASTKRGNASKIGFFGTGLKYSLATMLREGIDFKVFVGTKEVKVGTRKTDFVGQKLDVITINNEKTSITTDAGINWQPWFAIREIYSNTVDEDGSMELVNEIQPQIGHTSIYIEISPRLGDVTRNWQNYFAFKRKALFEDGGYRILEKRSDPDFVVFRKGIRVYKTLTSSIFDYDIPKLDINESRVATHDWQVRQRAAETLALCDNTEVIKQFISKWKQQDQYMEYDNDFWTYLFDMGGGFRFSSPSFSEAWYEVLKDKRIVPADLSGFYGITHDTVVFPQKLIEKLYKHFGDRLTLIGKSKEKYIVVGEYNKVFDSALELFSKFGFNYDKSKIKIAKFKDKSFHGAYDSEEDLILISEEMLAPNQSIKRTYVLFEEIAHAKSGAPDITRNFQNYLIESLVGIMEAE